jgi:hypothetical protein
VRRGGPLQVTPFSPLHPPHPTPTPPRFNPVDRRCAMELDDVDPTSWGLLKAAAMDYIAANEARFAECCEILTRGGVANEELPAPGASGSGSSGLGRRAAAAVRQEEGQGQLAGRRGVLLVEAPRLALSAAEALPEEEAAAARVGVRGGPCGAQPPGTWRLQHRPWQRPARRRHSAATAGCRSPAPEAGPATGWLKGPPRRPLARSLPTCRTVAWSSPCPHTPPSPGRAAGGAGGPRAGPAARPGLPPAGPVPGAAAAAQHGGGLALRRGQPLGSGPARPAAPRTGRHPPLRRQPHPRSRRAQRPCRRHAGGSGRGRRHALHLHLGVALRHALQPLGRAGRARQVPCRRAAGLHPGIPE